jgi:hypothetical protein
LDPEARRERARKAALARWVGVTEADARCRELVEKLIRMIRDRPGAEFHVRNLRRILEWLGSQ